ncbi:unnamed protein product [Psylliodes chrysocephalus]|uniref:Uncharacterized protein n=1 Tax=Psylliodes chrysocephalus TaxID=3402493 RepID=A0A9P0CZD6_9CUCU|nr:unnamed protein product [Psylliodes chrysocephala]
MGSLLAYDETRTRAWLRIDAITEIADLIAKVKSTGSNDPLSRDLCRYGSIVPVWSVKDRTSIGHQVAAQVKINNLIRVNVPSVDDVINVYLYIADLADRYKTVINILDPLEMLTLTKAYELDQAWPSAISKQKAMLAAINIYHLPPSLIDDSIDFKQHETYTNLQTLNGDVVETNSLVAHISTSEARIRQEWPALSDTSRLVFWEIKAISRASENARFSTAASLLYVTALCRGGSVTDAWVNSRAARLETEANVTNLAALLSPELILKFFNTYPRDVMSEEDVYGALLASYTLFENNNFKSLMWIVEQSAAQNIAPATALADIVSRTKGVDVDYLMDMIPFSQFQAVAELVAHIIYNRFCSLSKTPVHQARYADLAYIGVVLHLNMPDVRCLRNANFKNENFKPVMQYEFFRKYFSENFNITFGSPKSDTCQKCDKLIKQIDSAETENERNTLQVEKSLHVAKVQTFYEDLELKSELSRTTAHKL